ncbi:TRAP transporter small permease subunit [Sphingomonas sp.]|uniref:TRAP transporter small permease subunit n=1 Tax=Sphingomonas sp. TaxID=28214 RepID=UPI001B12F235|nr:TRAP transporter small permease subunit [Sphingomonas sp.]MBO9714570.1 TRAP transporter small permease subunit [Sphingomonas sp.]
MLEEPEGEKAPPNRLTRIVEVIGAAALLVAVATDAIAVAGRHLGFALLGSIELFQMAALAATSAAIVLTTLAGRHAAVHVLVDHVSPGVRRAILSAGHAASALAFALLLAGSIWIAIDLWPTHEMTELLGLPLRWFRLIWIAAAGIIAGLFLVKFWREARG